MEQTKIFTPAALQKLKQLGVQKVLDVLMYFPRRYLDFSQVVQIKDVKAGQTVTVTGNITSIAAKFSFKTKKTHCEAIIKDQTGSLLVVWFNQGYLAKTLKTGEQIHLAGKAEYYQGLKLVNPIYEVVAEHQLHTGRLVPVYKLPPGLYEKTFRNGLSKLLPLTTQLEEDLPAKLLKIHGLPDLASTVKTLHFPESKQALAAATERLAYTENLIQQLALAKLRQERKQYASPAVPFSQNFIKSLVDKLPFTLTLGQKKALWQILQDLEFKTPANRLLLGDVGSGKTIVAFLAAMQVLQAGSKCVMLVPTEVLAMQHYRNFLKLAELLKLPPSLFCIYTQGSKNWAGGNSTKAKLQKDFRSKAARLIIGTHALLEEQVSFMDLAFIVIDEQHRFGVEQRAKLLKQIDLFDKSKFTIPHVLSMSATPIPRTLALTMYSDLDVSYLTDKPANRAAIKTWVVPENTRMKAYEFVLQQLKAGRQGYIIAPLVEESEKLVAKSAKAEFIKLQKIFPSVKLGLLHGKLKPAEKNAVLKDFQEQHIQLLVATTVVEVGVDIQNANVMVIENADRFGLAQLHQLRGRIGRSSFESYCLVFAGNSANPKTEERLKYFARTNNGFTLAEYDLKLRGWGSLFGTMQTGFDLRYPEYLTNQVLSNAQKDAQELTTADPDLKAFPLLRSAVLKLKTDTHTVA